MIKLFVFALLLLATLTAMYLVLKKVHVWLPRSLLRPRARPSSEEPVDIMFLLVDHFEMAGNPDRLNAWVTRYPKLADKHRDSDGKPPQHTWFYAIDLLHEHELESMSELVRQGYGEVELHWHHSHEDQSQFVRDLRDGLSVLQRYGFMLPYDDNYPACFAFIHGNWSLDNSRGTQFCGVDNEIGILRENGCYADFTYPALFQSAQPSRANQILYAIDDGKSKSYERGRRARVGQKPMNEELMVFQGPLAINWRDWRFKWHPTIEDGDINVSRSQHLLTRIRCWVEQRVHLPGQPNWWFVKAFCHGAQDRESLLSNETDEMHRMLNKHYNDGKRFRLHYVTAREAFNIVKAAEDGHAGNAGRYRDYLIPHPLQRSLSAG